MPMMHGQGSARGSRQGPYPQQRWRGRGHVGVLGRGRVQARARGSARGVLPGSKYRINKRTQEIENVIFQ